MAKTVLYKKAEMTFAPYGGPPGSATIARLVGPEISRTMGAGLVPPIAIPDPLRRRSEVSG